MNKTYRHYTTLDVEAFSGLYKECAGSLLYNAGYCPREVIQDQLDPAKGFNDAYIEVLENSTVVSQFCFKSVGDVLAGWCVVAGCDSTGSRRWFTQGSMENWLTLENSGGYPDIRRIARESGYGHAGVLLVKDAALHSDYFKGNEDHPLIKEITDYDDKTLLITFK